MLKAYAVIRILELIFHFIVFILSVIVVFVLIGFVIGSAVYGNNYNYNNNYQIEYFGGDGMYQPEPTMFFNKPGNTGSNDNIYVDPIPVEPLPEQYYGGIVYDYIDIYYYNNYYNQLTTGQVIAITAVATAIVVFSVVVSFAYYALVLYTIVLSFRMASQIKQSAAVYAAVEQKECQLETQAPFVYVVADPTNGNQPVLLQPIDPSLYQMQNYA